jgi:ABC-2 type transport system ATP-binding protein
MTSAEAAISTRNLRKRYPAVEALRGVDLEIGRGEVFALLGPNGAGKTTFVEILEGFRHRTSGDATVLGVDPAGGGAAWRARIGVVLQTTALFDTLTVTEVVAHFGSFYPAPMPVGHVIELAGLAEKRDARCGTLSGGQRRRVDLALGLVGDPELIFLDEPTTGFDPSARHHAWDTVKELTSLGKTVLLTTHYLDEAEALAGRVGVILRGELTAVAAPAELGGRQQAQAHVTFTLATSLAGRPLPELPGTVVVDGNRGSVLTDSPTAVVTALAAWARAAGVDEIPGLAVGRPSLEDVYLQMIRERGGDGPEGGEA